MPEKSKTNSSGKEIPKETKKEKSKYGLSKETLERILEEKISKETYPERKEKETILSEEELKNPIIKNKANSENEIENEIVPRRKVFLEKELSEISTTGFQKQSEKNETQNQFEYISKNPKNSNDEKKYISYETSPNTKLMRPEEISKSGSNLLGREAGFVSSVEQQNQNKQQYEVYSLPKKFSHEDFREENNLSDIKMREAKMHYYND